MDTYGVKIKRQTIGAILRRPLRPPFPSVSKHLLKNSQLLFTFQHSKPVLVLLLFVTTQTKLFICLFIYIFI